MGAAAAAPYLATAAGGLLSSQGSKKAAKRAGEPRLPSILGPSVGSALGLINQRLQGGFPRFAGPFVAGLNPLQSQALTETGRLLGPGQQGFEAAQRTAQGISETGLDAGTIDLINRQLDPLYASLTPRLLAQTREGQAQRGGFFGEGGARLESEALQSLAGQRAAQVLGIAPQFQALRLQGAGTLANLLGAQQSFLGGAFGLGEAERGVRQQDVSAQFQEFLRTQPENAIPMLQGLLGATPFFQPPVPTNALQALGAGFGSMVGQPGFWQMLQGKRQPMPSFVPSTSNPVPPLTPPGMIPRP